MNKRKIDGFLLIAVGLIPIASLVIFSPYKFVLRKMVVSSHGHRTSEDIYPDGYVSVSRLVEDNTGLEPATQFIIAGLFAFVFVVNGILNFSSLRRKNQNQSEQDNPGTRP